MKETVNLLAAAFALLIATGLGWLAWEMNQPEPVVEAPPPPPPALPQYRVGYSLLEKWLGAPPKVVSSKLLPVELREDMELQCKLLIIVTGLGQQQSSEDMIMERLRRLRLAFPDPETATVHTYRDEYDDPSTIGYDYYPYFAVIRSTNPQMVDDFRHTVRNATLDEIDYVIENLEFKVSSWKSRLTKVQSSPPSNAQYMADTAFLNQMPAYIYEWARLKKSWKEYSEENPDLEGARIQWAMFEKKQLPILNAFIEGSITDSWLPNDKGIIEAKLANRDVLYLQVEIAGRKLFLPLNPPGDPRLGLTMATLGN